MSENRYTAAMLAELVGVPTWRVRSWQRRGWLTPSEETCRLAYFDFTEVTVARQLAALHRAGAKPALIGRKLTEISRKFPDVGRPLAELSLVLDGHALLVRREAGLIESGGQSRFDFDALDQEAQDEPPATVLSAAAFLARPADLSDEAAPGQLAKWAEDFEESGDLRTAAEMYRAALAAGGPKADICFQLAEVLYRMGDLAAARERYFNVLELDEQFVEARANLGCVLLDLGEKELAIAAFEGALASHGAYADVHYHLARTLDDLGEPAKAAQHWRAYLELAPDSPWAQEAVVRLS